MDNASHQIIFTGEILPGHTIPEVKKKLASIFKLDETRLAQLFLKKSTFIKSNISHAQAIKYEKLFRSAGAICHVVEKGGETLPATNGKKESPGANFTACPACNFKPTEHHAWAIASDGAIECPSCGILLDKYKPHNAPLAKPVVESSVEPEKATEPIDLENQAKKAGFLDFNLYWKTVVILSLITLPFSPALVLLISVSILACYFPLYMWIKRRGEIIFYAIITGSGVMLLVLLGFIVMVICRLLNAIRKAFWIDIPFTNTALVLFIFSIALMVHINVNNGATATTSHTPPTGDQIFRHIDSLEGIHFIETDALSNDLTELLSLYGGTKSLHEKMLLNTVNENKHVKIEVDGKQLSVSVWTDENSAYIGDKGSKWVTYNTDYNDI